ncbi:hypothetical protein PSACC_00619 [Paramicrosporidium saccamoebae]|uniref:Uncharacterized protein n=1 Tax=Paramicrosporidium saccamoebae TaxID=1246581 RepID=A0A2H9TP77_9FUNG|nr:hypothetical protein PSACC_00619 [Paramicrosporidium saccamoebae]
MASYHSWLQQVVTPVSFSGGSVIDMQLGPSQLLICLFGTLQCGVHNIPIEVWLPKAYPREAPYLFIRPSPGIAIRATQHIDPSGRVFHPMLNMWRPESSVAEILRILVSLLAVDPPFHPGTGRPVYASQTMGPMGSYAPPAVASPRGNYASPGAASSASPMSGYTPSVVANSTRDFISPQGPQSILPDDLPRLRKMLQEKLNRRFNALQKEAALESDRILAENTQLSEGEKRLAGGLAKILEETARMEEEIDLVRSQKERIRQLVNTEQSEVDYDTLVMPHGPISKQIMDVVAMDLATQDLIYTISKAFNEGNITLTVYLRHVRDLAREQFLQKALLAKIRREFPLINN